MTLFLFTDNYHQCGKCERLFADEETLKTHLKSKHPDRSIIKKHKCHFCSYSSDRLCNFKHHMLTHTKEKPFECSNCCKKFSQKSALKRHIRIHTKETPYECIECGKKFNQSSNLKKHKLTVHDKLQPHVCATCGLTYAQFSNYQKHMLTHINAKSYSSKKCSASFDPSSDLGDHAITCHTRNYPHGYKLCGKGLILPNRLKERSKSGMQNSSG